jgi:hypothetical protein
MNIIMLTRQQDCIKFLLGQQMLDKIKPSPGKPGCCGLFPLKERDDCYAIVDLMHGHYTVVIFEGMTLEQAAYVFDRLNEAFNNGITNPTRVLFVEKQINCNQ